MCDSSSTSVIDEKKRLLVARQERPLPKKMKDAEFLSLLCERLDEQNYKVVSRARRSKRKPKRASVAIIIRAHHPSFHCKVSNVKELLMQQFLQENNCLQILYILRAIHEKDRFSGHVAFPGGKQDPNETLQQTAEREVWEEVGLKLEDSTQFQYLGRISDHASVGGDIAISPFVYLQLVSGTVEMKLSVGEIRAVRWVPVQLFLSSKDSYSIRSKDQKIPLNMMSAMFRSVPDWAVQKYGLYFDMPNIYLPPTTTDGRQEGSELEFMLWGLTMRMTMSMFALVLSKNNLLFPYSFYSSTNRLLDRLCRLDILEIFIVYENVKQQEPSQERSMFLNLFRKQFSLLQQFFPFNRSGL